MHHRDPRNPHGAWQKWRPCQRPMRAPHVHVPRYGSVCSHTMSTDAAGPATTPSSDRRSETTWPWRGAVGEARGCHRRCVVGDGPPGADGCRRGRTMPWPRCWPRPRPLVQATTPSPSTPCGRRAAGATWRVWVSCQSWWSVDLVADLESERSGRGPRRAP